MWCDLRRVWGRYRSKSGDPMAKIIKASAPAQRTSYSGLLDEREHAEEHRYLLVW